MNTKTTPSATFNEADIDEAAPDDGLLDAEDSEFGSLLDDLETLQDFRAPRHDW